jgi:hypothetical protein
LISLDLSPPELSVRVRNRPVQGTSVPKAPIDEESNAGSSEHNVRFAVEVLNWPPMD